MNLETEKKILMDWISNLKDESIIRELKSMKDHSHNEKDWWDELTKEQKKSIERGLKDSDEGRLISYEQVKDEVKKWLTKSDSPMKQ
ncbi:MAG: hypothetical protein R3A12_03525 [Ignavibacteria bacterium]